MGIYALGGDVSPNHNLVIASELSGLVLQDGVYTASQDRIIGGLTGVTVVAIGADTTAALRHVKIAHTTGTAITAFQCCGFTATSTLVNGRA